MTQTVQYMRNEPSFMAAITRSMEVRSSLLDTHPETATQAAAVEQYLMDMARPGQWGDHFCQRITEDVLHRRIMVYTVDSETGYFKPPPTLDDACDEENEDNVLRFLLCGNHYYPLLTDDQASRYSDTGDLPDFKIPIETTDEETLLAFGVSPDGNCWFRAVAFFLRLHKIDFAMRPFWFNEETAPIQAGDNKLWVGSSCLDLREASRREWQTTQDGGNACTKDGVLVGTYVGHGQFGKRRKLLFLSSEIVAVPITEVQY